MDLVCDTTLSPSISFSCLFANIFGGAPAGISLAFNSLLLLGLLLLTFKILLRANFVAAAAAALTFNSFPSITLSPLLLSPVSYTVEEALKSKVASELAL